MLRDAPAIAEDLDALDAELWASGWLGQAWADAEMGEREPEHQLCLEVVGRASARPSPHGLAAVAALRRVAPAGEESMLDGTVAILTESQPAPPWLHAPTFTPVQAWQATDVWDSERVLFVEYETTDPDATGHTLMAQILEPGGRMIAKLAILRSGAVEYWAKLHEPDEVPMPVAERPVEEVLADLAAVLRLTDMYWPRHDDEDYIDIRALAWARCREYLPDWPEMQHMSDDQRRELIDAFLAETAAEGTEAATESTEAATESTEAPTEGTDVDVARGDVARGDVARVDVARVDVVRSLANVFCEYGEGYIARGPLAWSPDWVGVFLTDWLPRKAFLDPDQRAALPDTLRRWLRFALRRRGVDDQWIEPVVAAVDTFLPEFIAALDDEWSWGPAKQIVAELTARGIDPADKAAVNAVISELNAARLARWLAGE